jgi:hypothetical protein
LAGLQAIPVWQLETGDGGALQDVEVDPFISLWRTVETRLELRSDGRRVLGRDYKTEAVQAPAVPLLPALAYQGCQVDRIRWTGTVDEVDKQPVANHDPTQGVSPVVVQVLVPHNGKDLRRAGASQCIADKTFDSRSVHHGRILA